ncbi:cinnamoyl-CoA reductase-like SNL6 [Coffea eugenioides]|uniref:cinnamoyl-CoA reductase-like SNL6 n=1 Tax=Coffea eugenioides TaxID=49369 RepID=UPI000F60A326|nr:cinnamoyl-CoA reductase-like SNL6 [Coffea eugenioides]
MASRTVCVMDASGRLGSTLVDRLLKRGYTVHAAVQTEGDLASFSGLANDNKNLKVFHSDPFDYHSVVDALKGCSCLFYTFEPPQDHSIYDENMVEVEVRAAHNVVEACDQTDTMEKVVFTSSATAVIWRDHQISDSSAELDEKSWSEINFCRKFKLWHALSKTLAEKTAWALAMDRGVSMVSINAGLLMAPDLSIRNPYLKGAAEMYENGLLATVDLDFLVDAHICVSEDISTYGRYLCFNHVITNTEDAVKLAKLSTASASESQSHDEAKVNERMIQQRISNKKLNKVMVDFDCGSQLVD